ncbi:MULTISPECIES: hypothetical protein [Zoogloeaceae]|jgi:hypothetical protein|uniref:Uncharacterized protein n=1 Tax=Thauera aminoaromatica TaxID=164330 RepID=A0A5C7SGM5_THASP|nr:MULTISPECIES: hypothetical protein [Zoogloeaceae]TXH82910.1 MAG: hypothetical protein E6Q80_14410 [Thauera aminoaromatica]HPI60404.1 hypothetical protein [Zoogloea sp.]
MFADTALTTVDTRPYFERVLCHALQTGVVDNTRLDALRREGAKGIVQLATYFGTPNLRPELEAARTRLVTLVGLALEAESGGKIEVAGCLLRDKTLLALSKAGADRLRKLHTLPTERLLGAPEVFRESEKDFLARCTADTPMTYARYLAEQVTRERNKDYIDATYWLVGRLGVAREDADEWHVFCESVINSALLVLLCERKPAGFFSVERFMKLHEAARKKRSASVPALDAWLEEAPQGVRKLLQRESARFVAEVLPVIREFSATEIYRNQDRFSGLFFFDTSSVNEITHHDKACAEAWTRITGNQGEHTDVQCGVLLMVATGLEPTRSLLKRDATRIWDRFRESGFDEAAVARFIDNVVPFEYQSDVRRLWEDDLGPEASLQLDSDDTTLVMNYLQDTCRAGWKKKAG